MPLTNLEQVKELTLAPGIRARVVNTGNLSVAHVVLDEGALLPLHSHPNEQIVNVIDGTLELIVADKAHLLELGRVMVLPPMVPHAGRALTRCYVVDIFHPAREDFVRAFGVSE
jgi:quercetin dioxygenase-like cupin family protein